MRTLLLGCLLIGFCLAAMARAEDEAKPAAKDDMQRIEGSWSIAELIISGVEVEGEFLKDFTVVNDAGGGWSVRQKDEVISQGTSTFDEAKSPKTVDFTATDADGKVNKYIGIYELEENKRRLCYVKESEVRPREFSSAIGSDTALITLERVPSK